MNQKNTKFFLGLLAVLLLPGMLWAATGKVRGIVTDAETNEPLLGANLVIQGTVMGAATDDKGGFIILNVPVGRYSLVATYMGYQKVTVQNLIVTEGLTTEQNFSMPKQVLEGKEVVIVAEKPLVNKNATNDIKVVRSEAIENMPIRGYANIVAAQVGAVSSGTTVYVRGGRQDEVGYYVDGVLMNNPYDRSRTGEVSQNALEEISYQPGGMNAEYGMFNSGVVSTSTKVGGQKLALSGEVFSDQFLDYHEKKFGLGTYSYGINLYSLSASGPVPGTSGKLRFFGLGEYLYRKDCEPTWAPTVAPSFYSTNMAELIAAAPEPVAVYGPKPGNQDLRWNYTANLYFDQKNYKLKVGSNITTWRYQDYTHDYAPLVRIMPKGSQDVYTVYAKATWVMGPKAFIEANTNYYLYKYEYMDHTHGLNFIDYTDPAKNLNVTAWGNRAPQLDEFARFYAPGRVYGGYNKENQTRWNFKVDGTWQASTIHELKWGGSMNLNVVRFYNVQPWRLSGNLHTLYLKAAAEKRLPTEAELKNAYRSSYADNAGYDFTGESEVNAGRDDARRPKEYSFYLQDKMEFKDLVMNLGLHVDHIRVAQQRIADPLNILLDANGLIDESNLLPAKNFTELSPRLGFSFPVTDRTVFHLQYGKYVQPATYSETYITWSVFASNLQNGNFTQSANPGLRPIKTTSYEVGFEQQLGMNAAIDITAFYKEIRDQIYLRTYAARPSVYALYINGDFGNVKGFSFDFQLRRTARVMANANYTLQWANGTGSDPSTQYRIAWQNPNERPTYVAPLDFDQRHTASVNVDFRTLADDGPEVFGIRPLAEVGLNIWMTYGSGLAYTPETAVSVPFATAGARFPMASINSGHRPQTAVFNLRLDKRMHFGSVNLNPYIWVINLFNTELVETVYNATGLPDDDGWLNTTEGQVWAAAQPMGAKWYHYKLADPENWGTPRQIRLGLRIDFK